VDLCATRSGVLAYMRLVVVVCWLDGLALALGRMRVCCFLTP
jgi:hypothetical protein